MPQYYYKCSSCEHEFEIWHSIKDKLENCEACDSIESLFRIPDFVYTGSSEKQVGAIVNSAIKEAKEEIASEKRKLTTKEYGNDNS